MSIVDDKKANKLDLTSLSNAGKSVSEQSDSGVMSGAGQGLQLGASTGNPWAAAMGGIVGGLAGALSAKSKRDAYNRGLDAQKERDKMGIESNRNTVSQNILQGLSQNLSRTLVR